MSYRNQLHPWCIICQTVKSQNTVNGRFRRRTDAEAHLQFLQRRTPGSKYVIVYDTKGILEQGDRMLASS